MKITHLGVGEAFDDLNPNNSHLLENDHGVLLLDCGYNIPNQLWRYNNDPDFLDGVFISHFHSDHYFGLPEILMRMLEDKREKPFVVIGQKGIEERIKALMEFAFKDVFEQFTFQVKFAEVSDGDSYDCKGMSLTFADTDHTVKNLAIRVENEGKVICYSGDGTPTDSAKRLYQGADIVIHEAYLFDKGVFGHAYVTGVIPVMEQLEVKHLILSHMQRDFRLNEVEKLRDRVNLSKLDISIPEAMDDLEL